jgi:cell division protein FtsW (lipid II flippase)
LAAEPFSHKQTQSRLLYLAGLFLVLAALELTLSAAVRARGWEVSYRWSHWLGVLVWGIGFAAAGRAANRYLPGCDPYLLPVAALLSGWGVLTIWRLSPVYGLRQAVGLGLVLGIFILGLRLPPGLRFLRRYKYLWLTSGLLLAALTLILGTNPLGYGPHLWLGCCGVYFQPSELLKLLLVVYLSAYAADKLPIADRLPVIGAGPTAGGVGLSASRAGDRINHALGPAPTGGLFGLLIPTFLLTGLAILLLLVQRDLGTASIFLFLYTVVVYVATGRKRLLLFTGLSLGLAALAGYALFDVVRLRVDAWLNPWSDPSGRSYQIVQSLIAVANGGISGRGLGLGAPSLVPIAQSDFIFAAIAEEGGLPLVIGLLCLIALMATRGLRTALHASDAFQRYLATGLTAYLCGQSVLIIGGNLRLLPLTGVTLPFVSSGGSSLLISFLSLLILLHISQHGQEQPAVLNPPQTRLYLQLGGLLLAGIAAAGALAGWWMVYRGPALITRTDNPRRAIVDRAVRRGSLLDRGDTPINETVGQAGEYMRQYHYPQLAPIAGYDHPVYGQSGLEADLDDYLSGWRGNPGLMVWWEHLLYGQPPPGLDVRLSIDLDLQRTADNLLGNRRGALVLINAQSGEILAIASHPSFDPNSLDADWQSLIDAPDFPLLDRASLGSYPTSASLAAFIQEDHASPLEIAAAAASLSAGGLRPTPRLALAVRTPKAGWVLFPETIHATAMSEDAAAAFASAHTAESLPFWQVIEQATEYTGQSFTWYMGGTLPGWQGVSLAAVVLLEEFDPISAQQIGQAVLQSAIQP